MVTMLKLDNGASLQVASESEGPGQPAQVGDSIIARYAESGGPDKIATLVRVIDPGALTRAVRFSGEPGGGKGRRAR